MDTDDLIRALNFDKKRRGFPLTRVWWTAIGVAATLAAIAFLVLIGPRPDIAEAAERVRFLFKFVVTVTLTLTAFFLVFRMSQPGSSVVWPLRLLFLVPMLLAGAIGIEFLLVPSAEWGQRWIGSNSIICLTFIPLVGLAPLAVLLAALRYSAPTKPGLAGAAAGLLAGGVAATFYAAHCTDDSPFFVATWYSIAILVLVIVGFVWGKAFIRW